MSGNLLQSFAKAAEKQIAADAAWMRSRHWSRRSVGRMSEERRSQLSAWETMPPVDGAKFLLKALAEPRGKRIGR